MTLLTITAWAVGGIPEIGAGDDLAVMIGDLLATSADSGAGRLGNSALTVKGEGLTDGDIIVVTSKIVSKAEGRFVSADNREAAITAETVRVVASREHDGGVTRIVENRLGIIAAAAGVDASNTPEGTVLLLPIDPDASARALCAAWRERFGVAIGVIISDTLGRAWRQGQTDAAIGASGVLVVDDLRGVADSAGRSLEVTLPAIADEIAALADLVKGKVWGCPVAVVRGLSRYVTDLEAPGARTLTRTGPADMFRLGTDEALAAGRATGLAAGRAEGLVQGRAAGLAEGRAAGLTEGRSAGLADGYDEGYATGFAEGSAE